MKEKHKLTDDDWLLVEKRLESMPDFTIVLMEDAEKP